MASNDQAAGILSQLLEAEKAITCGQDSQQSYFDTQKVRFAYILSLCRRHVPDPSARVLDIGRSELTACLHTFYRDVHTLGLDLAIDDGGHRERSTLDTVPHISFDLLNSPVVSSWPDCGRFDLIVFSEVIEHLSVAPEYVLAALSSLLTEDGILICSTPNAADIIKRIRLAFGRNPYERLRLYSVNPGHIREYTQQEMIEIADSVGLRCIAHSYFNWIHNLPGNSIRRAVMNLLRLYPPFRTLQAWVFIPKDRGSASQIAITGPPTPAAPAPAPPK